MHYHWLQIAISVVSIILLSSCQARIHYDNWKLVVIKGSGQNFQTSKLIDDLEIDEKFRIIRHTVAGLEVAMSPGVNQTDFNNYLQVNNLKSQLLVPNIESLIKRRMKSRHRRSLNDGFYDRYMNWEQMEKYILNLQKTFPQSIKKEILGLSHEGRNIYLFTISSSFKVLECPSTEQNIGISNTLTRSRQFSKSQDHPAQSNSDSSTVIHKQHEFGSRIRQKRQVNRPLSSRLNTMSNETHLFFYLDLPQLLNENNLKSQVQSAQLTRRTKTGEKPVIFIDGGSHSREWISPAAVIYLMEYLAQNPSLTEKIEWQIIPNINPDGYVYSWNQDRFWRKTRSNTTVNNCKGADINRNFGHQWGKVDTSKNACAENYGGATEFSEIETQLLRDALIKVKSKLKAYLSIHNWGQDILHPYSFSTEEAPETYDRLRNVGEGMSTFMFEQEGIKYRSGKSSVLLYPASGTAIDWVYDNLRQPLTFLIELRDKLGLLGFILPESYIKPTSKDLVAAVSYLASTISHNYTNCS